MPLIYAILTPIIFAKVSALQFNANHFGESHGCHSNLPIYARKISDCTILGTSNSKPIYLIGDSNAEQFSEALIGASKILNRKFIVETISGCPFLPGYINAPSEYGWPKNKSMQCQEYYESVMVFLSKASLGNVVISFSDQYFREPGWELGKSKTLSSKKVDLRKIWLREGLSEALRKIQSYGHKVLFVFTIPQLNYLKSGDVYEVKPYTPSQCSISQIFQMTCDRSILLSDYLKEQIPIKEIESDVLKGLDIESLDLMNKICSSKSCSNRKGLFWIYRDGAHISVQQSKKLSSTFAGVLRRF